MATTLTSADESLRDAATRQLEWDPQVDASLIGVSALSGVVTLTGYVDTYTAKLSAERAVRRATGVTAVVNDLDVRLTQPRIDPEIAKDAVEALNSRVNVPKNIAVTVHDGHITLTGKAEWMFEKVAAEKAVKHLRGVRGVFNRIEVAPTIVPKDVQKRITRALHQQADLDAHQIHVEAVGRAVKLTGTVRTWRERDEVMRSAWGAPGVAFVENYIEVVP
jgi:osmotically-inducible protein OsmY